MSEKNRLVAVLKSVAQQVLLKSEDISITADIQDLGFDSKTLVQFTDIISARLESEIHPGVLFEYTSLDKFADYLLTYQAQKVEQNLIAPEKPDDGDDSSPAMPVIIGGGIAGMLISHQLAQDNIPHIIIGKPEIGDTPKLGESMTEVVSIEFARRFKHLARYFYPKAFTPFFMGDLVAGLRFDFISSLSELFITENIPQHFIHIDRLGFDKALYQEVVAAPECQWIEAWVDHIEYSKESDKVLSLQLSDGQVIKPSYVWDCTNYVRLLGREIDLPYTNLDARREVIFTHYYQKEGHTLCDTSALPWLHATSLLKADKVFDRLEGVSWLIPLGSYVSVGISMLPEDIGDRSDEEIIALLSRAYARRGLDYGKHFTCRKEIVHLSTQHFMYQRVCGKNWSLVGGSGINTWFTSGSNMSIAAFMASIATKIIRSPETYNPYYTAHVNGFVKTQAIYDSFMASNIGAMDALRFLSGVVEQSRNRMTSFFLLDEVEGKASGAVARELWQEGVTIDKTYLDFLRQIATHTRPEERQQQTTLICQQLATLADEHPHILLPYLKSSEVREEKPQLFI